MRQPASAPPAPVVAVDGWPINLPDPQLAVREIVSTAKAGHGFTVFTMNLDHLDKLRRFPEFRAAYKATRYTTADGAPIAWMARRQNSRVKRTTGADLILPIATAAAAQGVPIYLFGTYTEVLDRTSEILKQHAGPGLQVVGMESPSPTFDPHGPEADAAIARIAASGAKLCLVALGAPKQELFAARAVARGSELGYICIGAGLDFLAGFQKRAPDILQRNGLEWLWRLATNPRRLAGRYARCAVLLGDILLIQPTRAWVKRFASSTRPPLP